MAENRKPVVVFLCLADFAASAYNACQAVNRVGIIEAHHIVLSQPPYDFPAEVICPLMYKKIDPTTATNYNKVKELIDKADLIHCWNNEREGFPLFANLQIPYKKVRSYTFTGTSYRIGHTVANQNIRNYRDGSRVIVQDPLFLNYLNEFPVEYIPHAVDTDLLKPNKDKIPNTIGFYNKADQEYKNYIQLLKQLLQKNHPKWRMIAGTTPSWWNRLQELSRCMFFFQNLSQTLGNPGRSTWEAMAMGIPTFTYISPDVFKLTSRLDSTPVQSVMVSTLENVLKTVLNCTDYSQLSENSREWVINNLGYIRVGKEYTKLFEELL